MHAGRNEKAISPRAAFGLAAFTIAAAIIAAFLWSRAGWLRYIHLDLPPAELASAGRRIAEQAGYLGRPFDTAYGFELNREFFDQLGSAKNVKAADLAAHHPILFGYRESTRPLIAERLTNGFIPPGRVYSKDPAMSDGMLADAVDVL